MPMGAPGKPTLRQSGADDVLAGEKRRAAGGAGLLAIVLEETNALLADAVDVRRFVAHQAVAVGADVSDADVVAPDDEDVWFLRLREDGSRRAKNACEQSE